jgi:hypothetical protein
MGTEREHPDIEAVLDSGTDTAFLRLHLDIVIPRQRFIELASLMDAERFNEAEALMLKLRPDTCEYLHMFFEKDLRARSKSAPRPLAARVA